MEQELNELSKSVEKAVSEGTEKAPADEIIKTLFKHAVSRLFERAIVYTGNTGRMEYDAILQSKVGLIRTFRRARLAEHQQSLEWYEQLFDDTVKEILEFAGKRHEEHNEDSKNIITLDRQKELSINPDKAPDKNGDN